MSPHDELRDLLILLKSPIPWDELDKALAGPRAKKALIHLRCCRYNYVAYKEAWKLFGASKITHDNLLVAIKRMRNAFDNLENFLLD
jgi:hypothetical protein